VSLPSISESGSVPRRLAEAFESRFQRRPTHWIRAPGRVNLIGEHTDYNQGFVLPMAIEPAIWIAVQPRLDRRLVLRSLDFGEEVELTLGDEAHGGPGWMEYVKGVAWVMRRAGLPLRGWQGIVSGDIPSGAGLSSSAALELAAARAFALSAEIPWDPVAMARLAQAAEHEWVGVHCGIMDQLISACGRAGHALLLDCRSLEMNPLPLPLGAAVAVLDTGTRRGLVGSVYNERRAQCEAAAAFFGRPALRDVTRADLESRGASLDPLLLRRARHVITENERTQQAGAALARGQAADFGQLMNASHASLAQDYEVSSEALDRMVEAARRHPACFGARMTGAGFGGCAVALVDARAGDFAAQVAREYHQATGLTPNVFLTAATDGVTCAAQDEGAG